MNTSIRRCGGFLLAGVLVACGGAAPYVDEDSVGAEATETASTVSAPAHRVAPPYRLATELYAGYNGLAGCTRAEKLLSLQVALSSSRAYTRRWSWLRPHTQATYRSDWTRGDSTSAPADVGRRNPPTITSRNRGIEPQWRAASTLLSGREDASSSQAR